MSKARANMHTASGYTGLAQWIIKNAHWYYPELDRLGRPDWSVVTKLIMSDGVTMRDGSHLTKNTVMITTRYWRPWWEKQQQATPIRQAQRAQPKSETVAPQAPGTESLVELQLRRIRGSGVR